MADGYKYFIWCHFPVHLAAVVARIPFHRSASKSYYDWVPDDKYTAESREHKCSVYSTVECSMLGALMILVIILLIYIYNISTTTAYQLPHILNSSIATICNIWKWHLICWLYYLMKYSCRVVVVWKRTVRAQHHFIELRKTGMSCSWSFVIWMGSMQSLISTRRLHQSLRPTKFNMRLDFRPHRKLQTALKRKRWPHQDVNQAEPTIRWSPKNFD